MDLTGYNPGNKKNPHNEYDIKNNIKEEKNFEKIADAINKNTAAIMRLSNALERYLSREP